MEIKVDVHAVHPSSPREKVNFKTRLPKKSCGSWGTPETTPETTPESSPVHNKVTKTYSNAANSTEINEDVIQRYTAHLDLNKVLLFAATPLPRYDSDHEMELEDIGNQDSREDSAESAFEDGPCDMSETPSPLPVPPIRKWKDLKRAISSCNPFTAIDPQGKGYIRWLLLVTFCFSYNAWCIALRATFPYQTPENTPLWMMADYFCDLIYLLDVTLVKPRLMYLHDGFWVDDLQLTKTNYKKKLQYKIDVISLLPLDILYIFFGTQMVILRLPRLFKLQTFWEFHQALDRYLASPYKVRIGKTLFYIFHLIHLNACAYYAMSDYIGLGSNGWVYDNKGNAYIRCFYFATKTATSIGKNPKPETTIEHLFMTAAWLMGVFVFALLIGQIRGIIAAATRAKTEYRKSLDGTIRYLRRLNMPAPLQRRVGLWFNYTWNKQRCFDESKILNWLPFNMKRDVSLEVHISTLSKVQLFRDCSSSLLRDLVLQMRPVSFLPGDAVVRRGDVGHEMYIIKSGECCVMSEDEDMVLATLTEGSVFGDITLLGIEGLRRRTATVRSRGYSSLFALSRNDLEAALKHHKEAALILRRRADQIIRENAARHAREKMKAETEQSLEDGQPKRRMSSVSKRRLSAVSENKEDKNGTGMEKARGQPSRRATGSTKED